MKARIGTRSGRSRLTEENLHMHSSTHIRNDSACELREEPTSMSAPKSHDQIADNFDGSDDGDLENIALRRAASLEALKAYGGCFASGFLAMQDPLPWTSRRNDHVTKKRHEDIEGLDLEKLASEMVSLGTESTKTTWSSLYSNAGCPRPDSDTLSQADIQSLKSERKWSWRSIGRKRRSAEKWSKE
ncbi:Nn.00g014030.m01.CDS01 [Neocucurbitaria sp. VM-36]